MIERTDVYRVHEGLFDIADLRILTAVEHLANGSTPPHVGMRESFRTPYGLLEGSLDLRRVISLRKLQYVIPACDVTIRFLGPDVACFKTVILELPDIDPVSGETEDLPSIFGVFVTENGDSKFGGLVTDPKELERMGLNADDIKGYLANKVAKWLDGKEETLS